LNVSLVSVDSKIPNLALMKISAWHKARGDKVKFYDPLFDKPDLIYASKIFDFTSDYFYFPKDVPVIKGGIDYGIKITLPDEIENCCPDYELYGHSDYSMGFTTRGCIRNCKFCKVPEKEGKIRAVGDIYDFWRGQEKLMLLDNNLTAMPDHFERICKQLTKERIKTNFSQGLDIRLINSDMAKLLKPIRLWKRIHFAFDNVNIENHVRRGIKILTGAGIHPDKLTFYVLIGYDSTPEEDLYRVELLRSLKVNPFVMPYNKYDLYQRRFARWVNVKSIFKSVAWEDYAR
jgi:hypothetical protein